MRILLIYPGHSVSTFDIAFGYERALRALGHEVRAYNYHSALAFYQTTIDHWRGLNPGFAPDPNAYLLVASEHAVIEAVDFVPQVVLIVSGMALHRRAFELLHRLALPMVLILTESPYIDHVQARILAKGHIAAAFTNDRNSVWPLEVATNVTVEYLPHSFDPERHRPMDMDGDYSSDVFFHGTLWPERKRLFYPLKSLECDIHISGVDPYITNLDSANEAVAGTMDNDELARHYNGTRIALNHHRTFIGVNQEQEHIEDGLAYSLGPRAYEIAACGTFQLCDSTRPELGEVFGDSVAIYSDAEDLRAKILYYLAHDSEREEMRLEALERVQRCTFEARGKEIVLPLLEEVVRNGST